MYTDFDVVGCDENQMDDYCFYLIGSIMSHIVWN